MEQQCDGAFFWDYSAIGLFGIDGIRVLLVAIPFSERTERYRMNGMRFTRNTQNMRSLGNFWREIQRGRSRRSPGFRLVDVVVFRSPPP